MSAMSDGTQNERRVRFVTFGCKANQYDTQVLREALVRRGFTESADAPELLVVNTCTVTAEAGRKARQLARRVARETPEVKIAMIGCLAESEPEVLRELPNVEWVLGNGEVKRPAHFLRQIGEDVSPEEFGIPAGITAFQGHTRAFLKIQDGCDQACAFCIIPSVRGKSRSEPAGKLEAEVRGLLAEGYREIVLCGIHIGHWGRDLGQDLGLLLETLARVEAPDGDPWRLRLSSIEATEVPGAVLEAMAKHPERIACHLHMPMQSGDDRTLRAMNRWYDTATYLAACARIRRELDRPAFTADLLVGFPGEDERSFQNTLASVREAGFARIHVFPFSARPGTAAEKPSTIGRPVAPEEVRDRRARLGELASELAETYRQSLDGLDEEVVLEGTAGLSGRYQRVKLALDDFPGLLPSVARVRLKAETTRDAEGRPQTTLWGRAR